MVPPDDGESEIALQGVAALFGPSTRKDVVDSNEISESTIRSH